MDGMKGRIADQEVIHCGTVAMQDCGTGGGGCACGVGGEEEGLLSVVAIEVGRRPAVSKLQM